MKTRRAQEHLDAFEVELDKWLKLPPYTVTQKTDCEKVEEVWGVWMKQTPERLAMLLGDFVCCLRSSLDQSSVLPEWLKAFSPDRIQRPLANY